MLFRSKLIISNAPVGGMIAVSHSTSQIDPPIMLLVVPTPFKMSRDIQFDIEPMGNGDVDAKITRHINL